MTGTKSEGKRTRGINKGRGQEQSQKEKEHEGISNRRVQEQSQMKTFGVKEVELHFEYCCKNCQKCRV